MDADAGQSISASLDTAGDRVHLVVPPASDFLRTVRLVAADAAGRAGCDLEQVEDFRIAVDELCHLLMTVTDHFVHLTLTTHDTRVVARGSARARAGIGSCELDHASALIVAATADHHEIHAQGDEVGFVAVKRGRGDSSEIVPGRLASRQ